MNRTPITHDQKLAIARDLYKGAENVFVDRIAQSMQNTIAPGDKIEITMTAIVPVEVIKFVDDLNTAEAAFNQFQQRFGKPDASQT